jgi:hypothetical protein
VIAPGVADGPTVMVTVLDEIVATRAIRDH